MPVILTKIKSSSCPEGLTAQCGGRMLLLGRRLGGEQKLTGALEPASGREGDLKIKECVMEPQGAKIRIWTLGASFHPWSFFAAGRRSEGRLWLIGLGAVSAWSVCGLSLH